VPRQRIETTFHETFALNLPALASVLQVSNEHQGDLTPEDISRETSLGPNYVKAMPRYARGCGLLKLNGYGLTDFGRTAMIHDPYLLRCETQWLMHYHMSAPSGPGPGFWNHLIARIVHIGDTLGRSVISQEIGTFVQQTTGKALSTRTLETTATAFLGSYAKSDGLGSLGLLEEDRSTNSYIVGQAEAPPLSALACALVDHWESSHEGASEVLLKELGRQDNFAGLFFLGSGMLGALLTELQSKGVVTIKRDAPPFVVTKLWRNSQELMDRLYA
jgi:hypothetical protein